MNLYEIVIIVLLFILTKVITFLR